MQVRTSTVDGRRMPDVRPLLVVTLLSMAVAACTGLGYSDRVLWRVPSPDGRLVAVCREVPAFDGPGYDLRLEHTDGSLRRRLYQIGDGDPCTEVAWSPDGRTLAVLSGHVARVRFVDVAWALDHPDVATEAWSWRQVDVSTAKERMTAAGLGFVSSATIELQVGPPMETAGEHGPRLEARRLEIPLPIVTGHR